MGYGDMNKPKIDIRFDSEKKVMAVFVDDKDTNVSFKINAIKNWKLQDICRAFNINHYGKLAKKNMYQEFSKNMGMGPKRFKKILEASVYREVIAPREDAVRFYCMRKGGISFYALYKFLHNEELYMQAYIDAMNGAGRNVIPFVWKTGRSTQELKKHFGKGVWKTLCKNSLYRNTTLSRVGFDVEEFPKYINLQTNIIDECTTNWGTNIEKLSKMRGFVESYKRLPYYIKSLFMDAWVLADRLGVDFDYKIVKNSPSKPETKREAEVIIQSVHNDLVKQYNEQKEQLSKVPYKFEDGVPKIFNFDGVVATRIDSPHELQTEGRTMHHCVGSYSDSIRTGRYLVYHLEDGVERATLGISVLDVEKSNSPAKYTVNQMYGVCNRPVESDRIKKAQEMLLKQLNSIKEK